MPTFLKTAIDRLRASFSATVDRLVERFQRVDATGEGGGGLPRWAAWAAGAVAFIAVIYYPVGMFFYDTINDDVAIEPDARYLVDGGSRAVAMAATLVDRETEYWAANKPFWMPAAALDNMPNYQQGMVSAISRFAIELGDFLARMRGSSSIDADVNRAVGFLKFDGTIWYWGQGNIIPMTKSETTYKRAVEALDAYNRNVAAGRATYDRRADNLIEFLNRVAADLGSASASLDERAEASSAGFFNTEADDVFYNVKGRLYGFYLVLRELGVDFAPVIKEKQAGPVWDRMLVSLKAAAAMDPLIVANGDEDSLFVPSHLRSLESSLLRARTQIRELGDILQK
jgi:hypothetical protein